MTCETCGRPAENGQQVHWLGCEGGLITSTPGFALGTNEGTVELADLCEHDECSEPKKPWAGKGAKPKYCAAGHKKEK